MRRIAVSNRAALVMSAAALIMSAGFAGGPALARAAGINADKVDGLHAVKAAATPAQRKGKLVATDPATGSFKPNVIPNAAKFPATVPAGVTLRGGWSYEGQNVGAGDYGSTIDYGARLPGAPGFQLVTSGPTAQCPGELDNPAAAPGYLCLYLYSSGGFDLTSLSGVSQAYAMHWHLASNTTVGGDLYVRGTYAVTAGPSPLKQGPPGDGK